MARRKGNFKILDGCNYYLPSFGGAFALLFWLLIGALAGNVIVFLMGLGLGLEATQEYSTLVAYPIMFIPPLLFVRSKSRANEFVNDGLKLDNKHFAPLGAVAAVLLVALATVAIGFCVDPLGALLPEMPEFLKQMMESMTNGNFIVNFISVSIFAPLCEEWLCRGVILRGLIGRGVKPLWAIMFSAFFFALIHLNPWQAIPAFAFGCLFGYVYYRTGSLKLTMLMHFVNNTLSLVLMRIDGLQDMNSWSELLPAQWYWTLVAGCLLLVLLVVRSFSRVTMDAKGNNFDVVKSLFSE